MNAMLCILHVVLLPVEFGFGTSLEKRHIKDGLVYWNYTRLPVIFGTQTELFCYVSGFNQSYSPARTWRRGTHHDLLMFNGASSDSAKFEEVLNSNGFGLLIQNLSESDVNMPYSCANGFDIYINNLTVNEEYFELHPTNNTVFHEVNYKGSSMDLHIAFKRVFPVPRCICFLNKIDLTEKQTTTTKKNKIFFAVNIWLQTTVEEELVCASLSVNCSIGTKNWYFADILRKSVTCAATERITAINTSLFGYFILASVMLYAHM